MVNAQYGNNSVAHPRAEPENGSNRQLPNDIQVRDLRSPPSSVPAHMPSLFAAQCDIRINRSWPPRFRMQHHNVRTRSSVVPGTHTACPAILYFWEGCRSHPKLTYAWRPSTRSRRSAFEGARESARPTAPTLDAVSSPNGQTPRPGLNNRSPRLPKVMHMGNQLSVVFIS